MILAALVTPGAVRFRHHCVQLINYGVSWLVYSAPRNFASFDKGITA